MRQIYRHILSFCSLVILLLNIPKPVIAEVIDPELYIQKNGYHSQRVGDDGKTPFYNFTERTNVTRVTSLERDVNALPKDERVFKLCEFMRGGIKAKLIQSTGKNIDVAVSNYGYRGATVACVLKHMYGGEVGTQIIYKLEGSYKGLSGYEGSRGLIANPHFLEDVDLLIYNAGPRDDLYVYGYHADGSCYVTDPVHYVLGAASDKGIPVALCLGEFFQKDISSIHRFNIDTFGIAKKLGDMSSNSRV
jgi:hypothetical protein